MKHLKIILALFIATTIIFSCKSKDTKPGTVKVEKKEMTFEEVSKMFGSEVSSKLVGTSEASRGKPVKSVIVVWFNDMTLTQSGNVYTTTLPAHTQWAGVQSLTAMRSLCNWYLPQGTSIDCTTDVTGQIRSWATDTDYNVHVSNVIN